MSDQERASADPRKSVAIVAGGGTGIGAACSLRLAGLGYHVIVVGRREAPLLAMVDEIARGGGSAAAFPADVRDWDRMGELQKLVAENGLDVLINSAGGQFSKPTAELSPNGWHAVVDTNLTGTFHLCRQLYPALRKRRGAVVNVVADMWRRGEPGMAHSSAARAGVVNLTRTLAKEWAADGIRLNAVSPGVTDTPGLRQYAQREKVIASVPLGRAATADEIAEAILFVARSAYITGDVLTIDGGLHLV